MDGVADHIGGAFLAFGASRHVLQISAFWRVRGIGGG
jgi:hypothetical protein